MTKQELIDYINKPENGLVQEKTILGITTRVSYKPGQIYALQEIEASDSITKEERTEKLEQYSNQVYFILSYSQNGKELLSNASDRQWFSKMVNQLAFNMHENVLLTSSESDTLQLLDYHYPRMYGMAKSSNIMLAFKAQNKDCDYLKLKVKDIGLATGDLSFKFLFKDIQKINKITLKH